MKTTINIKLTEARVAIDELVEAAMNEAMEMGPDRDYRQAAKERRLEKEKALLRLMGFKPK